MPPGPHLGGTRSLGAMGSPHALKERQGSRSGTSPARVAGTCRDTGCSAHFSLLDLSAGWPGQWVAATHPSLAAPVALCGPVGDRLAPVVVPLGHRTLHLASSLELEGGEGRQGHGAVKGQREAGEVQDV